MECRWQLSAHRKHWQLEHGMYRCFAPAARRPFAGISRNPQKRLQPEPFQPFESL